MGQIADDMVNGVIDAETGEFLDGDEPGYPRVRRGGRIIGQHEAIERSRPKAASAKLKCPHCQKSCKGQQGLAAHIKAKHPEGK